MTDEYNAHMTYLEIEFDSGSRRIVELDRRQPLSIGSHPTSDVTIAGDDVEPIHCRISWSRHGGYEVVAGGGEGVDVNGTLVNRASLSPGDVLRVGAANVVIQEEASPPDTTDFEASDLEPSLYALKPLSSEVELPRAAIQVDEPLAANEILPDDPPLTADEILADEPEYVEHPRRLSRTRSKSSDRERTHRPGRRERTPEAPRRKIPAYDEEAESFDGPDEEQPVAAAAPPAGVDEKRAVEGDGPRSLVPVQFTERFRPQPQRPGERDAARSLLVWTLAGGSLALVLIGATFYFILSRQSTQADFDAARSLMDEGKYSQAITAFQNFLALHPRDPLADDAEIQMWIARIEAQTSGASPHWHQGLKELNDFIAARRDVEGFSTLHDEIRKRAEQIALGAATTAGTAYDRRLLDVSDQAAALLKTYATQENPATDPLKRIQSAWRTSEAAILKQEALTGGIAQMTAALKDNRTVDALKTRREMLARYPEFAENSALTQKLIDLLQAERALVSRNDEPREGLTDDHENLFAAPLSFAVNSRSRTDEVSVGQAVFGLAGNCCYAVDSITGEPLWRRVIGWDVPFFPVAVSASTPSLLAFDTNHNELLLLDQSSGRLLWRQPEVVEVSGAPWVEEGQIYITSTSGVLNKVDLVTGRLLSQLQFAQPVSSPVGTADGAHLTVCGDQELVYTLSKRPLECVAVSHLGHLPQSIEAPLLPMGALLLVAENLPNERSRLHVLDSRSEGGELRKISEASVPGHVVDAPVIRGRDLFVPSSGERLSSFTVSDEPGQSPLTVGPRFEGEGRERSPVFLATGPDRQIWMASRKLRRLRLAEDVVDPGQQAVDIGRTSQPLQQLGKKVYVGRQVPHSSGLTIFQIDRDQFASQWQTVLGPMVVAFGTFPNQADAVAVTDAGDVFRVTPAALEAGGFVTSSSVRIKLPDGLSTPLHATTLADNRIAVWCDDPQPQLWFINRLGQIERNIPLPGVLQSAPVLVGSRIALPLKGRVQVIGEGANSGSAQAFVLPQGDSPASAWTQLIALDDAHIVAVSETGPVRLLRIQANPQPYIEEAGTLTVEGRIEHRLARVGEKIALASGARLQLVDGAALEPIAEVELDGAVSSDVWPGEGCLFLETDHKRLHCFDLEPGLKLRWTADLNASLAGAPLAVSDRGEVLVALSDGAVVRLDALSGEIRRQAATGETLSRGPLQVGSSIVVTTADGSLFPLNSILDAE